MGNFTGVVGIIIFSLDQLNRMFESTEVDEPQDDREGNGAKDQPHNNKWNIRSHRISFTINIRLAVFIVNNGVVHSGVGKRIPEEDISHNFHNGRKSVIDLFTDRLCLLFDLDNNRLFTQGNLE